jgi:dTDP-4-amino-4,6-dideoxygalactose transaminase
LSVIKGSVEVTIDDGVTRSSRILSQHDSCYVRKLEWVEVKFLAPDSVLHAACNTEYVEADYIRDYDDFKKAVADHKISVSNCRVPMLDLKAHYQSMKPEMDRAVMEVLESAYYINGPAVAQFEGEFAQYIATNHCVGLSTGTDALFLALEAMNIRSGDEVIIQGNAYIADSLAVHYSGAKLVMIDQDETYGLDLTKLRAAITTKTRCVIAVHMYGSSCNMDELVQICQEEKVHLVEDCAHSHGATWRGKPLGSFGDISCFSFYPGKTLGAYGDGGACCTNNAKFDKSLRLLRNYGSDRKYYNDTVGKNNRLDTLQAAVLSVKLKYLPQHNARRREIAAAYKKGLGMLNNVTFPVILEQCVPVFHQFVLKVEHRDKLLAHLIASGIDSMIHYPIPIHRQKAFEKVCREYVPAMPLSDTYCDHILSLPMCPMMTDEMVQRVVTAVHAFYNDTASA